MKVFSAPLILIGLAASLTSCGSGDGSKPTTGGPSIEPNSILLSDMLISFQGQNFRITDLYCRPDLSHCQATFQGEVIEFTPEDDPDADVNIYETLGEWEHMEAVAVFGRVQGMQVRYAAAGGVTHPNSIPRGSATWVGHMVGLDSNNHVVRGGAVVQLSDFADPKIDVLLTPETYSSTQWRRLPLRDGVYSERKRADRGAGYNYIKGEFYGPNAEETGGIFEINRRFQNIVGAFGATRGSE